MKMLKLLMLCIVGTVPVCISNNDKINFIFNMIDVNPKNTLLNYQELYLYQKLTDPQLPLIPKDYILICDMLGANWREGLTKQQFNQSYNIYDLGTDLDKDYRIMMQLYETF